MKPKISCPNRFSRCFFATLLFFFVFQLCAGESVRIATYNLRNYLITDRLVDGTWLKEYPKPESEKSMLRRGILEIRPDILLVQEIGGRSFLHELADDLKALGLVYDHLLIMKGSDTERMTGLLSQIKPSYSKQHRDLIFNYFGEEKSVLRGMLEVGFDFDFPLSVFSVHLKSRYTSDDRDFESVRFRTLEAQACRDRILNRLDKTKTRHYVIAGDFNDSPNSAPLRRFYKKGARTIGEHIFARDGTGAFWTYFYHKEKTYSTVDGFVVSPLLALRIVEDSALIWDAPEYYTGSDHRLVYFDLQLSK